MGKADISNKGKFISEGLWSLSRHPNYVGEITFWTALTFASLGNFSANSASDYLALASPAFTVFLLTSVSGIPMLEKSGMKRWGNDPEYLKYVAETPILFPRTSDLFTYF